MAGLWGGLARTLTLLEELAAAPDEETGAALPPLQYALHTSRERLASIAPPDEAEAEHEELLQALEEARDATGEVVEAFAFGGLEVAGPLVWEWRGSLFRVRLARRRLLAESAGRPEPSLRPRVPELWPAAAGSTLVILAAVALAAGAFLGHWALLAAGLVALGGGVALSRP